MLSNQQAPCPTPWTWLAIRSWKYGAGDGRNNNNHVGIRRKNKVVIGVYDTYRTIYLYDRCTSHHTLCARPAEEKCRSLHLGTSVVGVPFFISYIYFRHGMSMVKDYHRIL